VYLLKGFHFDNTSALKIFPIFPATEKTFHVHFRNKPAERVFCPMSVRAIRREFAGALQAQKKEGTYA
jgi:hypothetical protein